VILHRLAQALASQNWSTVIVEILVVVVGIFIGLQVDDWNAARKDHRDEQVFLERLHSDVLRAEGLSDRLRSRRLETVSDIVSALEVLFVQMERDFLTEEECRSIGASNLYNLNVPNLPAFQELIGVGRLEIIRDADLRAALIGLEQTQGALLALVAVQSSQATLAHLPSEFPALIQMEPYLEEQTGEVRAQMTCDVAGMRADQRFLNMVAVNADGYDAFVRDGLAPWSAQFQSVHDLLDESLGIKHDPRN
jgi:hypothetical protein